MKVVLIRAPFIEIQTGLPIGLGYIQKALKDAGHDVSVMDFSIDVANKHKFSCGQFSRNFTIPKEHKAYKYAYNKLHDYCEKILLEKPDVVGFHLSYSTCDFSIELAKLLKKQNIRTIAGGPDATYKAEELINSVAFDAIVRGYGEESVNHALTNNGIVEKPLNDNKDYRPDFSGIEFETYGGQLPILTTRGCPRSCMFCSQRLRYFYHTIDSVIDQIKAAPANCEIMLNDSNFNINTKRTKEILGRISHVIENRSIHAFGFEVDNKFDLYTTEFSKCNFSTIRLGIESGSKRLRAEMRKKNFDDDDVVNMVREIVNAGSSVWTQFIFCYPGETNEDRRQTVRLMHRLATKEFANVRQYWYRFVVHHGTEKFFRDKYGVRTPTIREWYNNEYNSKVIENLADIWRPRLPHNAAVYL